MIFSNYVQERLNYFNNLYDDYFQKYNFTNLLVRYAEIGLKSDRVRQRMERRLIDAIKIQLKKNDIQFTKSEIEPGRIYIAFRRDDIKLGSFILLNTPGIKSISPYLKTDLKLEHITSKITEYAVPLLRPKMSIGVKVKIIKRSMFPNENPKSISDKCSEQIMSVMKPEEKGVINIAKPDLKIFIEIRNKFTCIYSEKIYGFHQGLPIEGERASSLILLGRPHDFSAIATLSRRGQNILPVFFRTNKNKDLKFIKTFYDICSGFYPVEAFYSIQINLEQFLRKIKANLPKEQSRYICSICRYYRFKVALEINRQDRGILKRLSIRSSPTDNSNNLFFSSKINKKRGQSNLSERRKFKFFEFRGIVDGEGEGIYCPVDESMWAMHSAIEEPIMQPLFIRTFDEIRNSIYEIVISNLIHKKILIERLKYINNWEGDHPKINIHKRKIEEIEKLLILLEKSLDLPICDYKTKIGIYYHDEFKGIIRKMKIDDLAKDSLSNAKLIRLF